LGGSCLPNIFRKDGCRFNWKSSLRVHIFSRAPAKIPRIYSPNSQRPQKIGTRYLPQWREKSVGDTSILRVPSLLDTACYIVPSGRPPQIASAFYFNTVDCNAKGNVSSTYIIAVRTKEITILQPKESKVALVMAALSSSQAQAVKLQTTQPKQIKGEKRKHRGRYSTFLQDGTSLASAGPIS
jgi:hypothetical protein